MSKFVGFALTLVKIPLLVFYIIPVPRVLFDGWNANDYHVLFSSEDEIEECVETLYKFVKVNSVAGTSSIVYAFILFFRAISLMALFSKCGLS
jgi:hypothetical protein